MITLSLYSDILAECAKVYFANYRAGHLAMASGGDHRDSTHSSTGATKSSGTLLILKISSVVKSLSKAVPTLSIVDVATSCRQCHGPVQFNRDFCSQPCALKYWERLRQRNGKASGKHVKSASNSIEIETSGMIH